MTCAGFQRVFEQIAECSGELARIRNGKGGIRGCFNSELFIRQAGVEGRSLDHIGEQGRAQPMLDGRSDQGFAHIQDLPDALANQAEVFL